MERKEITVHFADLRRLAATVPTYLAKKVGIDEKPLLKTAVEDDFGLAELDTESLILEFSQDYKVYLTSFNFTGFISSEGPDSTLGGYVITLVLLLVLPLWLSKLVIGSLCWLFSRKLARKIWRFGILAFLSSSKTRPTAEVLTTGDFVASAAAGYFVKREKVNFVLTGNRL